MIIYCIENLITHKRYIGQYSKCNSNEELQKSRMWGHGILIKKAIEKYGRENFKRWVLIKNIQNFKELNKYEILWIAKLKTKVLNGYNITDGGEGFIGQIFSQKSKDKMSKSKRSLSDEDTMKIWNLLKEGKLSSTQIAHQFKVTGKVVHRIKFGKYKLKPNWMMHEKLELPYKKISKKLSEECKNKIRNSLKNKPKSEIAKLNMKIAWMKRQKKYENNGGQYAKCL